MGKQQLLDYLVAKGLEPHPSLTVKVLQKMAAEVRGPKVPPLR